MNSIPIEFIEEKIKELQKSCSQWAQNDALTLKKLLRDWEKKSKEQ